MLNIKKRLSALIPNEGARGAIQNVLTVEWSGHKTVLVEVPSSLEESDEVELIGMDSAKRPDHQYGRLVDDDEADSRRHLQRPIEARPQRPSRDRQRTTSSNTDKSLPPLPGRPPNHRFQSENPFYTPESDESSYRPGSRISTESASRRPMEQSLFRELPRSPPTRIWSTFSNGDEVGQSGTAWSGVEKGVGATSPTSSRGTTGSRTVESDEDPFR